jgi:very-short-patch-repair endonuclease
MRKILRIDCELCNVKSIYVNTFSKHLKGHDLTPQQYYDRFINPNGPKLCKCGLPLSFQDIGTGYLSHCSRSCVNRYRPILDETRVKLSYPKSELHKKKLSDSLQGRGNPHTQETKDKISKAQLGVPKSIEHRIKLSSVLKSVMLKRWKNSGEAFKMRSGFSKHPNSLESAVTLLLNRLYPTDWKFVGDGSVLLAGLSPDIIHTRKKLIIECNGRYWHSNPDWEDHRKARLELHGYKILYLWDDEPEEIWTNKIHEFVRENVEHV